VRHAAVVTTQPAPADAVTADLLANPVGAGDVRTLAPADPGLYAWWPALMSSRPSPVAGAPVDQWWPTSLRRHRHKAPGPAGVQSPRPERQLDAAPRARRVPARRRAVPHPVDGPRRPGRRRAATDGVDGRAPARDLVRARGSARRRADNYRDSAAAAQRRARLRSCAQPRQGGAAALLRERRPAPYSVRRALSGVAGARLSKRAFIVRATTLRVIFQHEVK